MGMLYRKKHRGPDGAWKQSALWTIRYRRNGKQFQEATGTAAKTKARDLLALREGDIKRGMPVDPAHYRITFDEAMDAVVADYIANGKRSLDDVRTRIARHLTPFFGGRRLTAITTDSADQYRIARMAAGAAVASINREVAILKRSFRLAHRAGKVTTIPYLSMAEEHNTRTGFFEPDQVSAVIGRLPSDFRPIATFAYLTGWRWVSEVLPLEWGQVDLEAEEVRLEPGTTKNGRGRTFPFTDGLRELISVQLLAHKDLQKSGRICPFVFQSGGRSIAEATFAKAWGRARKAAGVPGRIMHDFRRTAVRNLVRAGIPDKIAMTLTGHKTRAVFDRYDIVSAGDLRDAATRLNARAEGHRRTAAPDNSETPRSAASA